MHVTDVAPGERSPRTRRRRWRLFVVVVGVLAAAAVVRGAVGLSGAGSGPVPRAPRELVVSPFGLGGDEGAMIAGMSEQLAANAVTTGQVIGPDFDVAALASQAPGRMAVTLRGPGQYVQFTLSKPANAIDVSYALRPGASAALTVQVDGATLTPQLALSSPARYVTIPGIGGGLMAQYFSDARLLLGRQLEPGDTVRLAQTAATASVACTIALADFYQVPAPAPQPQSSVSVVAQGADPTGRHDSTGAFARAIQLAGTQGKSVWIPAGTFVLSSPLHDAGATITGAGSWYSVVRTRQFISNPPAVTGPVNLSGFAIEGPATTAAGGAAISGSLGAGSVVSGLWVQGTAGGLALQSGDNYVTIQNSQILSTQAGGVSIGPGVFGAWVRNDVIRNTGGDGVALWSDSHTTVSNDTIAEPVVGNGIADYGGTDNTIISNVVADTHASGSGIQVASPPAGSPAALSALAGVTTVDDNAVLRCGSASLQAGVPFGAVGVDSGSSPVSNATVDFSSDSIDQSPYSAIEIGASSSPGASKPVTGVSFDGDTINGTGAVAVEATTGGSATFSDITGTGISVPGSYSALQPSGKPGFAFVLGPGNSGWSVTPTLATYPRGPSRAGKPAPATSPAVPGLPLFPRPASPSPPYQAPAPSPATLQPPVPPSPVHQSPAPPAAGPAATTQPPGSAPPPASPAAPSLSESAPAVASGTNVVITYSAPAAHQNAWVGIYSPGQPAGSVLPVCARIAAGTSGTVACNSGSLNGPGTYNISYGYGYGTTYHQLAGPIPLTVTGTPSTLSAPASTIAQGTSVQISYTTPDPNYNNWIGIYPYGQLAADGDWQSYQWAVSSAGTVSFTTSNLTPGQYYLYLNYNDTYTALTGPLTLTITS
jgi:hypothetical protein